MYVCVYVYDACVGCEVGCVCRICMRFLSVMCACGMCVCEYVNGTCVHVMCLRGGVLAGFRRVWCACRV